MNPKKAAVVTIALFVGALHFLIGPDYSGPAHVFVHSYLIDILLPMAMYLVAGLIEQPLIGHRVTRAIGVFGVGVLVETLQYFKIEIFGSTFDPFDYLMYGIGVFLGFVLESAILNRLALSKGEE